MGGFRVGHLGPKARKNARSAPQDAFVARIAASARSWPWTGLRSYIATSMPICPTDVFHREYGLSRPFEYAFTQSPLERAAVVLASATAGQPCDAHTVLVRLCSVQAGRAIVAYYQPGVAVSLKRAGKKSMLVVIESFASAAECRRGRWENLRPGEGRTCSVLFHWVKCG